MGSDVRMEKKKTWKKQFLVIVCTVLIVVMTVFTVSDFRNQVEKNEMNIVEHNLKVASNNCVSQISLTFKNYFNVLETMSTMLEREEHLTSKSTMNKLHQVAKENGGMRASIDFFDGKSYTSDGGNDTFYDEKLEKRISNGESFVSDAKISRDGEELPHIEFYTPLYDKNRKIFAALKLSVDTVQLSEALDIMLFDAEGYYHIIDDKGNYIAVEDSKNALLMTESFLSAIAKLEYEKGFSQDQIIDAFTDKSSGFTKYSVEDEERYAYYEPVGINNWVLMMIVPKDVVYQQARENIVLATILAVRLSVILGIVFLYVFYIQKKSKESAVLSDNCFRALAQQAGKTIFEWDFEKKKLTSTIQFKERFGREIDTKRGADDALKTGAVHPEDEETYKRVFDMLLEGNNIEGEKYRVKDNDGTYHWCELSGVVIRDRKGRPYKAIGSLEDIDTMVRKEEELIRKSENDLMTGVYNKTTTENLIKVYLETEPSNGCALMIIDIDNFKNVNDSLGHQYGDKLLKDVAERMKPLFRVGDVIGRIGGDEFFVFMKNCEGENIIIEKANKICEIFRSLRCEEDISYKFSTSIGISIFPRHGKTFDVLYKSADLALYVTKANGKNGFTIYDGSKKERDFIPSRTRIES